MKWPNTKKTENDGLLYVHNIINDSHCIFNKIDGSNDIGLDGYMEFIVQESATGLCVGVQVKSGDSYQNEKHTHAIIKSDKEHFKYWSNHTLPIAGIVYIPKDKKAYWIDITAYLTNNAHLIESGPYNIWIDKSSCFDKDSFGLFFKTFLGYQESFNKEWNLARGLKGIVDFKPKNERIDSIKSIFYFHRDCKESWYYLIHLFRIENDKSIQSILIYIMRHLISHGDIYWHKNNIIDQEIRKYGRSVIKNSFRQNEIYKLLSHIGENGISRGSVGQDIYPIIDLISNKHEILKAIILHKETTEEIRLWAANILINDFQYTDQERAINFCDSMINNFPKSKHVEHFHNLKQTIIEFGFLDFQG